jgi:carboxynorspermidine decarboxylase
LYFAQRLFVFNYFYGENNHFKKVKTFILNNMIDFKKFKRSAFVLEEARLRRNLELIKRVRQEADVHIIVAFKGFSMWSAFPMLREYLNGATASSVNEARLCFEEMKTRAHTYCAAYETADFNSYLKYSSHISFNSLSQFKKFKGRVENFKEHKVSCGLRVNPEFSVVDTDMYNPGISGSRLGQDLAKLGTTLPDGLEGLHVHVLCESSAADTEALLSTLDEKLAAYLPQLKWLNIGGGHLMTRQGYEVERLIKALKNFRKKYPHIQLILEPGSAVAWDTGVLVSKVLDIVDNHGVKTVLADISFTAHMPDTLEMPYRPRIQGATEPEKGKPTYRIGGVSCLSGDYMSEYSFEKKLKIGDTLIFEDMIHYTMVKTTTFNGVRHPDIAIWTEANTLKMVRRFNYLDFKKRLS